MDRDVVVGLLVIIIISIAYAYLDEALLLPFVLVFLICVGIGLFKLYKEFKAKKKELAECEKRIKEIDPKGIFSLEPPLEFNLRKENNLSKSEYGEIIGLTHKFVRTKERVEIHKFRFIALIVLIPMFLGIYFGR